MILRRLALVVLATGAFSLHAEEPRKETRIDAGWRTIADDHDPKKYDGFERPDFDDAAWMEVAVPHNWDDYGGSHRLVHGNRHGTAWYRRDFEVPASEKGRKVFLFFEGVGSYATVWVNGKLAGKHAGGRTTFTLDVTDLVHFDKPNVLAVRADHPAGITDLPWVCGGCSDKAGFSEGSQPMGIFRPVTVVTTNDVRVEPFGVHVWNDKDVSEESAEIHLTVDLRNYGKSRRITVESRVLDAAGDDVATIKADKTLETGADKLTGSIELKNVALWSLESPNLYTLETTIRDGDRVLDRDKTTFGIRTIQWPKVGGTGPFRLNGKPVFVNGTCEYEHVLGGSSSFTDEQIAARVAQFHSLGFNAFRDAHQPHNLRYQEYFDRDGVLWWTQFVSQIWYDTPEFRENFKTLLREWVRERRNSPSLVLWGLANESKLPPDFAQECVEIVRELDPTTSSQRLVTTCNSGKGTDWNVPQNWSGTYGGKPEEYAQEIIKQQLIGEYGAWRSLGLHTEGGYKKDGPLSEDRLNALMEQKIFLGESVREKVAGHFQWPMATHDNPGRTINGKQQQGSDGWDELDRIGPANNKGLLTLWGEPTDAYFLFRSNYAPAATDPMVYIGSHTWPDRWTEPGKKSGIVVYSNCDEVELFNDAGGRESLGKKKRGAKGTHFTWDDVDVRYNVLYAEGRVGGKVVARDAIVLNNLLPAPHLRELRGEVKNLTAAEPDYNYLYRVNAGGPDTTDVNGQKWLADQDLAKGGVWGSSSWAMEYADVPPRFGSQRTSSDVVRGTDDQALFQTYRYGREKLRYWFAVPDGEYRVELYFSEPWYLAGGGDATGWRLFDIAINGETVAKNVDLWKEAGFSGAVKKIFTAKAKDGAIEITFPHVASYQAVIAAIAISTLDPKAKVPESSAAAPVPGIVANPSAAPTTKVEAGTVYPTAKAKRTGDTIAWPIQLGLGGSHDFEIRYSNPGPKPVKVDMSVTASDGSVMAVNTIELPLAANGKATLEGSMNAGDYIVTVKLPPDTSVKLDSLRAQ
jgi:beta-galactosidase